MAGNYPGILMTGYIGTNTPNLYPFVGTAALWPYSSRAVQIRVGLELAELFGGRGNRGYEHDGIVNCEVLVWVFWCIFLPFVCAIDCSTILPCYIALSSVVYYKNMEICKHACLHHHAGRRCPYRCSNTRERERERTKKKEERERERERESISFNLTYVPLNDLLCMLACISLSCTTHSMFWMLSCIWRPRRWIASKLSSCSGFEELLPELTLFESRSSLIAW